MAMTDGVGVVPESPDLEFTIAPDELALFDEDLATEEEPASYKEEEEHTKLVQEESTVQKSSDNDVLPTVPSTTTVEISDVANEELSEKKTFVPITFEPFKLPENSEDTSVNASNSDYVNKECLTPLGEECMFGKTDSVVDPQQATPISKPLEETPDVLLPPGESSEFKLPCLEKLKPIVIVTPSAVQTARAPIVNNFIGSTLYQPPPPNNYVQQYSGSSPLNPAAPFTPFSTFSEPNFYPQPPAFCPAPTYSQPVLMCAVPEPIPPQQPFSAGPYGTPVYSSMVSAPPPINSFVPNIISSHNIQHIAPANLHTIPPPVLLPSCPPPVAMRTTRPPPVSMSLFPAAPLVTESANSTQYAVPTSSVVAASSIYTVGGKEKESDEFRFIVSFSNIYRFVRQAEFRKLLTVCGSVKHFKYQPPVINGAHGKAEACFTNRHSALRAKRLLSALNIGGAQIITSSPTNLVDAQTLSDPEKTKDVECMVTITNLLQATSRVFNWDNYQYRQKSSTSTLPVKPKNRSFPENKQSVLKQQKEERRGNNLITIRLGANIQTKLNTQSPPTTTTEGEKPPVTSITVPLDQSVSTVNSRPSSSSSDAWIYSLNSARLSSSPQPVPPPANPPLNWFNCNLGQERSSNSLPREKTIGKGLENDTAIAGYKRSNKTILASIEAINQQISNRKEHINKQMEKLYTENIQMKKPDQFCVLVDGLSKLTVEKLEQFCNATQYLSGTETMLMMGDRIEAGLLQQLLHRHRLLDGRVRAELLNVQALPAKTNPNLRAQFFKSVHQILSLHDEEARKSLIDELDQVIDVYKYKMKKCSTPKCSDSRCLYFHNASDYRRDPLIFTYRAILCPDRPLCKESVRCELCHTEAELRVHPQLYLSEVCRDWCDETGCPHQPGSCFKAHPKSSEMLFHPEWQDLYVKGLRNTFLFLASAVRNMHRVDSDSTVKVRVVALFPCEALVESAMQLLAPTAQRHLVRVATITNKDLVYKEAAVLLGTVSSLVTLVRLRGCTPFSDLRILIIDDLPSIIEESKMLDDFVCFVSLLYTTLSKTGCQENLQRVVVAQEVTDEEVKAAKTLLSTNFQLATRSCAPTEVDSMKQTSDEAPVTPSLYEQLEGSNSDSSPKQVISMKSTSDEAPVTPSLYEQLEGSNSDSSQKQVISMKSTSDKAPVPLSLLEQFERSKSDGSTHNPNRNERKEGNSRQRGENCVADEFQQSYREKSARERVRRIYREEFGSANQSSKLNYYDGRHYDQEDSANIHSGHGERKHSPPNSYASDMSSKFVIDQPASSSGVKRKLEEQSTDRKTWRINLSSVTVNSAKKQKERSKGSSPEMINLQSDSNRSDSIETNNAYLEEERTLRADHDEEYEVFKDMPEMHPDYEEIMEEFTKLYPAGDEDRRWKMFWNIKLETIKKIAWNEKKKDLIGRHRAAIRQKYQQRLPTDSKQSLFDMDPQLVDVEKFKVTDAYDSLNDQTDEMGVLGPPLRRLLRQARTAGSTTVSALRLFVNPDHVYLIRMCVDKLRKLLLAVPQSKGIVMRRTAVLADHLLTHATKIISNYEETRKKLSDLDIVSVAKDTLGQGPSEIMKHVKNLLGSECHDYISKDEFDQLFESVSSLHVKMIQVCRDLYNAPTSSVASNIKESEIPLRHPASSADRPPAQPQPESSHPDQKPSSEPWFVAEVCAIMTMPGISVEIFNRSLCDIFSRKPPGYKFTKKDLSLANDLKQLTGFNLTESMFIFALQKILSQLDDE